MTKKLNKPFSMNRIFHYLSMFVLILLLGNNNAEAQEQPTLREKANRLYTEYQYANAAALYLKLTGKNKPALNDLERLAYCYLMMNDFEAAETWYSRVVQDQNSDDQNLIFYGEALKANIRYAEAKKVFQDYISKAGSNEKVMLEIAGCDSAIKWLANPGSYEIKNEASVNTALAEFSVFPGGEQVYYTGEPESKTLKEAYGWTGNSFLRVYSANRNDDLSLSNPVVLKSSINEKIYHQGPVIANHNNDVLYVTATYPGTKGQVKKEGKRKYLTNNLELYIYTKNAGTGSFDAKPFPYNNVKAYSLGHAALSPDEKTVYFISDMPGGLGGTDIWYSELQANGEWGKPLNAGTSINTAGDEMFPTIGIDGTLYFSSNGMPGMGGLDIYSSTGSKSAWTKPVNMQYPVNSAADDFAFIVASSTDTEIKGYLSSNRKGGKGSDDIYSFIQAKPELIFAVRGTAYNKKTKGVLSNVAITLFDEQGQIIAKKVNEADGTFLFELDKEADYLLLGTHGRFYPDSVKLSTKGITKSEDFYTVLNLKPLFEVGKTIAIQNIHYDFDKDNIRPDAAKILDELVHTMRENPTLEIELGSHTDSRGVDKYNLDLSQRRAASMVNYLVSKGIARSRMVAKGYGETQLINRCANGVKCSEAEHQANRRTEVKILKY